MTLILPRKVKVNDGQVKEQIALLASVGICLIIIISEWPLLSQMLLWFWGIVC